MTAAVAIPPSMPFPQLDETVNKVKAHAAEFAKLSIDEKLSFLSQLRQGYRDIAEESVRLACAAKGVDFNSPIAGEEWLAGPMVTLRVLRLTEEGLREVKQYGAPRIPASDIRDLPDGRLAVKVFPLNGFDKMLLAKHVGEVYMEKGITGENLNEHQASFYRKPAHEGRICLVLGAGNVNAIPPTDVVYKMFVEGTVCVLKMNPVNAYLGPLIEQAFKPLVRPRLLRRRLRRRRGGRLPGATTPASTRSTSPARTRPTTRWCGATRPRGEPSGARRTSRC